MDFLSRVGGAGVPSRLQGHTVLPLHLLLLQLRSGGPVSRYLVLDLMPYRFSTRARKIARSFAVAAPVSYISLTEAGRFGLRSRGGFYTEDAIDIYEAPNRGLQAQRTILATVRNILLSYVPGVVSLARVGISEAAEVVLVEDPSLLWLGLAHKMRWGSLLVYDGRERPNGIRTSGSLRTLVSRMEPWLLPVAARRVDIALSVCESHASAYRALGFRSVHVVRNVPKLWPSLGDSPGGETLRVLYLGSLYPGRGVESLISAMAICRDAGARVSLRIVGPGSPGYRASLRSQVEAQRLSDMVTLSGPCSAEKVWEEYAQADVSTVLYEPVDSANDSLPNKLFESMMAGRCVLASRQPEVERVVNLHGCGLLVDPDPEQIAASIQRLAADREFVRRAGENGRKVAERELNWDQEFASLLASLRELLEGGT